MNKQNNKNRAQLVLIAIAAASILVGCGTEEQENSVVDIHAQPGMIASAIEPGANNEIDIESTVTAPVTVDIEAFFAPSEDVADPTEQFVQPPRQEDLVPPALPTPEIEEEEEEELVEEEVERSPFQDGCGAAADWKGLAHHHCDATGFTLANTDFHGSCEGGFTASKFVCEKQQNETEVDHITFEGMTIGGAGSCKPISALKSAAQIFCSSENYQSGKPLQPCDAGIDSDEESYRVFLFTCRR